MLDRNLERFSHLVKDLLDAARMQAGQLGVEPTRVDIHRLVAETVESFQADARRCNVGLAARVEGELPVEADAARVTQVLFNLLSNALKFTSPGGRVTVETERTPTDTIVRVRDTGAGLTPEVIVQLFRPFAQFHAALDPTRAGTGLGLYISKSIVELHGGRIWAESEGPGKGSCFAFTLPHARTAERMAPDVPGAPQAR